MIEILNFKLKTLVIKIEDLIGTFYRKEFQKVNQREFRVKN